MFSVIFKIEEQTNKTNTNKVWALLKIKITSPAWAGFSNFAWSIVTEDHSVNATVLIHAIRGADNTQNTATWCPFHPRVHAAGHPLVTSQPCPAPAAWPHLYADQCLSLADCEEQRLCAHRWMCAMLPPSRHLQPITTHIFSCPLPAHPWKLRTNHCTKGWGKRNVHLFLHTGGAQIHTGGAQIHTGGAQIHRNAGTQCTFWTNFYFSCLWVPRTCTSLAVVL